MNVTISIIIIAMINSSSISFQAAFIHSLYDIFKYSIPNNNIIEVGARKRVIPCIDWVIIASTFGASAVMYFIVPVSTNNKSMFSVVLIIVFKLANSTNSISPSGPVTFLIKSIDQDVTVIKYGWNTVISNTV